MSLLRGRFLHLEESSPLTVYRVRLWRGRRASLLYNRKDTLFFIRKHALYIMMLGSKGILPLSSYYPEKVCIVSEKT